MHWSRGSNWRGRNVRRCQPWRRRLWRAHRTGEKRKQKRSSSAGGCPGGWGGTAAGAALAMAMAGLRTRARALRRRIALPLALASLPRVRAPVGHPLLGHPPRGLGRRPSFLPLGLPSVSFGPSTVSFYLFSFPSISFFRPSFPLFLFSLSVPFLLSFAFPFLFLPFFLLSF